MDLKRQKIPLHLTSDFSRARVRNYWRGQGWICPSPTDGYRIFPNLDEFTPIEFRPWLCCVEEGGGYVLFMEVNTARSIQLMCHEKPGDSTWGNEQQTKRIRLNTGIPVCPRWYWRAEEWTGNGSSDWPRTRRICSCPGPWPVHNWTILFQVLPASFSRCLAEKKIGKWPHLFLFLDHKWIAECSKENCKNWKLSENKDVLYSLESWMGFHWYSVVPMSLCTRNVFASSRSSTSTSRFVQAFSSPEIHKHDKECFKPENKHAGTLGVVHTNVLRWMRLNFLCEVCAMQLRINLIIQFDLHWAERDEVGTDLWSHVRVIVVVVLDPPPSIPRTPPPTHLA